MSTEQLFSIINFLYRAGKEELIQRRGEEGKA